MKTIIKKVIGKITGKNRKFFPVVGTDGKFETVEKPRKFFPMTEREYLVEMRRNGYCGNGQCKDKDF